MLKVSSCFCVVQFIWFHTSYLEPIINSKYYIITGHIFFLNFTMFHLFFCINSLHVIMMDETLAKLSFLFYYDSIH